MEGERTTAADLAERLSRYRARLVAEGRVAAVKRLDEAVARAAGEAVRERGRGG